MKSPLCFRLLLWGISFVSLWGGNVLFAQNLTLSPYSRYGLGDVFAYSNTRNAAMGGIGIGSSSLYSANRLNPASYVDFLKYSTRHRFDLRRTTFEVSGFDNVALQSTKTNEGIKNTAGFRELSFVFPSNKKVAFALGFSPMTSVGYSVIDDSLQIRVGGDSIIYGRVDYLGRGGVNQAYAGAATSFFKDKLRVGANLSYAFGSIQYEWLSLPYGVGANGVKTNINTFISGAGVQLGAQLQDTLRRDTLNIPIMYRIGIMTDYLLPMNATRLYTFSTVNTASSSQYTDTVGVEDKQKIAIPIKYGIGGEISKPMHWYFGADVLMQDWKNFTYFNDSSLLKRDLQASVGGEITPNYLGEKYRQRVSYRFGAYYHQSYLNVADRSINDKGVTFGVGLPLSRNRQAFTDFLGRLNLSVEMGARGNLSYQPMREIYSRFRVGITISERWFIRRVVD